MYKLFIKIHISLLLQYVYYLSILQENLFNIFILKIWKLKEKFRFYYFLYLL